MIALVIGDVVGDAGCDFVRSKLPELKKRYQPDVIIANGENSSEGNGILPHSAEHLWDSGVDVITLGNHGLRQREIYDLLDQDRAIIRPANYHPDAPGRGVYFYDNLSFKLCVINLQGMVYLNSYENPFTVVDRLLAQIDTPNIIVDFHAEATSEKVGMGFYLEGKVSAVVGTHTHVPTADGRVLPKGTGYITDLGMCGSESSVLGVEKEGAMLRLRTGLPTRFVNVREDMILSGAVMEIDEKSGRCSSVEGFSIK